MLILPQHYHHPWSQPLHRTQGLREAISSDAWSTTEWACSLHTWLTLLRTGDRPPQRENCPNFKVSPLRKRVCPLCVQPPCTHVHTCLKLMASTTFVNIHTRTRKSKECLRGVNWPYWWMIDWLWWCATLRSLFLATLWTIWTLLCDWIFCLHNRIWLMCDFAELQVNPATEFE